MKTRIIVDTSTIPSDLTPEQWFRLYNRNIIVVDTTDAKERPFYKFMDGEPEPGKYIVIDKKTCHPDMYKAVIETNLL